MARGENFSSDYIDVDSGNWNNAKTFSLAKIMQYLVDVDKYRILCDHGTDDLGMELTMDEHTKDRAKVIALHRLIKTTQMLIHNSEFAIKKTQDRQILIGFSETLKKLEDLYPMCKRETTKENHTGKVKQLKINKEVYNHILEALNTINTELLYPLNRANLIFKGADEDNPFLEKQQIIARASGRI